VTIKGIRDAVRIYEVRGKRRGKMILRRRFLSRQIRRKC